MIPKLCRQCNKLINYDEYKYKDTAYAWMWSRKKYCSAACEKEYTKSNRKPYKLRETEHNESLLKINDILCGEVIHTNSGSTKGTYFEDLVKDDKSYELQMVNKQALLIKTRRWGKDKKHVLIVAVPEDVRKRFDEVYFFNGSELTKIPFSETLGN